MKNTDVAIIIPVYNEGSVIEGVVQGLHEFPNVVCVNDGSSDDSRERILASGAYLVDHPINMGQGAALQTGIEFARDHLPGVQYFATFDADGQHSVADLKTMLERIRTGDIDIVFGSRFLGEAVDITSSKRAMLRLATKFSNATSGLKLTDTHNGLRVFNRHVAETMQITMADMSHASEILEIVGRNKYRYEEVPVTITYTEYSRGKGQSMINAINIAFDTLLRKISK